LTRPRFFAGCALNQAYRLVIRKSMLRAERDPGPVGGQSGGERLQLG